MPAPTPVIHTWLLPLSGLYGLVVRGRNLLFDRGLLHEQSFPFPVICVGNLTVGGTGKTPHTEYLLRLLKGHQAAVLSRGYGRKTHGYLLASPESSAQDIGDEPWQIYQKFPDVSVAVDEKRVEGIQNLMHEIHPEVIVLDDAYQHRYIKAGLNILLTDYHRLMTRDWLMPAGRLREPLKGKRRANLIIITKCPTLTTPEMQQLRKEMDLSPNQKLYFSQIRYAEPAPVFQAPPEGWKGKNILLIAGIATPQPLLEEVQKHTDHVEFIEFQDHHQFTQSDLLKVAQKLSEMGPDTILLTTEKDAARLKTIETRLSDSLRQRLYRLPIEVEIHSDQDNDFNEQILTFVEKFDTSCKEQK